MRAKWRVIGGILILGILVFGAVGWAQVTIVGDPYGGNPYATIQAAIDACSGGETIHVAAGTYNEAITINKSVTVQATGAAANTIIDASATFVQYAASITANGVTFQGFTLVHNFNAVPGIKGRGIGLSGASGCHILDNNASSLQKGIELDNSDNNTISGNNASNNDHEGIYVYESDGNDINNNTVNLNSQVGASASGIFVHHSHNNKIHDNDVIDNVNKGIWLKYPATGNKVYENEVSGSPRGINLEQAVGNKIYNNNAISDNAVGIFLENSPNNDIYGNLITQNKEGIRVYGSSSHDNEIYNNDITSNNKADPKIGILLQSGCYDNTINFNNITGNTNYGVNNLTGNVVDATTNWWGDASGPNDPAGTNEVPPCTADPTTEINADGTGDKVSDNVDYCPWAGAETESGTVSGSGTVTNTCTGGDITINATGDHTISTAKYASNPGGTTPFSVSGNYYDVHLDNITGVTSLTVEFCPATASTIIYYWDGSSWQRASDQTYADGCITVTITADTRPSLSDLTGLPFGSSAVTLGDINGDGPINVLDARLCLQIATGFITPTAAQAAAADVDGDGDVDLDDAELLAKYIIGMEDELGGD